VAPLSTESPSLSAARCPDVQRVTDDIFPGVVDQESTEVVLAEENFDVAREREYSRIGRDNPGTDPTAAARFTA
jgi:hypothetical protein